MKVERQVAELQRSAVDAGKLEGSLSAVQNQLQETQGNLSSVKADLQQATNALTSEQAVQVGSNRIWHLSQGANIVVPFLYGASNSKGMQHAGQPTAALEFLPPRSPF